MTQEYNLLGECIHSVAPDAFPTTAFGFDTDDRLEVGNAQVVEFSKRLRALINAVDEQIAKRRGSLADPQEVAEQIGNYASGDATTNNPTADAEMLMAMMGQDEHRVFLVLLATMLMSQSAARPAVPPTN